MRKLNCKIKVKHVNIKLKGKELNKKCESWVKNNGLLINPMSLR